MIVQAFLLLVQAQQVAPNPSVTPTAAKDVVVIGRRSDDTEKAWRDCMARRCPPKEEMDAVLAHAEERFMAGEYAQARKALGSTLGRLRGLGREFPVELGDIWRVRGRLAHHLGEFPAARVAMAESTAALRSGLGADHPNVLSQRLELADAFAAESKFDSAASMYLAVAREARKHGHGDIEGYALLRRATLLTTRMQPVHRGTVHTAREAIAQVASLDGEARAPFRDAADILTARLATATGDTKAIDELIVRLSRRERADNTVLVKYVPPDFAGEPGRLSEIRGSERPGDPFKGQWIDVGFRIAADGSVQDVAVLRHSRMVLPQWIEPVLASYRGRRYAPLTMPPGLLGVFRADRVTYTSPFKEALGTRIPIRSGVPVVVTTSLVTTAEQAKD